MKKVKVCITGANGQLGKELQEVFMHDKYEVHPLGKDALDVTKMEDVMRLMQQLQPDIIIHAAAYTKVDKAEEEQALAFLVNAIGTRNIAVVAQECNAKLVYISTDYVFSGDQKEGYHEFHATAPINIYGHSKLAGEQFVQSLHHRYFIVRTSWLYGKHGHNFVKTILRLADEKEEISIVSDQIGSPTYAGDLARMIERLVETNLYGIYHVCNSGSCSWYEFAKKALQMMRKDVKVHPITTKDYGAKAKRPRYSILKNHMIELNGFPILRGWNEALAQCIERIK
ncbi:dTDP-4-dehydrorhamnose reductase [Bacillus cytotoxicus]